MNIRYYIIIISLFFSCATVQKSNLEKESDVDQYYKTGKYSSAVKSYIQIFKNYNDTTGTKEEIAKAVKSKSRLAYKIARNSHKIGKLDQAEKWYKEAEKLKYYERKPQLFYFLGQLYKQRKNSKEAKKYFRKYKEADPDKAVLLELSAESLAKVIRWKRAALTRNFEVKQEKDLSLDNFSDYSAAVGDSTGNTVYFTSNRRGPDGNDTSDDYSDFYSDIFYATKNDEGKWGDVKAIENRLLNSEHSDGSISFSHDFNTLFYTHCSEVSYEKNSCVIRYSIKDKKGRWSDPIDLVFPKLKNATIGHPAINKDKSRIYFSSDFQDSSSFGGKDIWYADIVDKKVSDPVNMGPKINTPGEEVFPYIREDGAFFFSSNGHSGYGGLDIFKYQPDSLGNGSISNLRNPINSEADDFAINYTNMGEKKNVGFFSSNRTNASIDNIWSFVEYGKKNYLNILVRNSGTREIIEGAKITINNGKDSSEFFSGAKPYEVSVTAKTEYSISLEKENYLNKNESYFVNSRVKNKKLIFEMMEINKSIPFKKINEDENLVLDSLTKILRENPNLKLVIESHEDYLDSQIKNYQTTRAQANQLVDLAVSKGVSPDRLVGVGYGEDQPLYIDKQLSTDHKFILKSDIGSSLDSNLIVSLDDKDQVIANLLNKRLSYKLVTDNGFSEALTYNQSVKDKIDLANEKNRLAKLKREELADQNLAKQQLENELRLKEEEIARKREENRKRLAAKRKSSEPKQYNEVTTSTTTTTTTTQTDYDLLAQKSKSSQKGDGLDQLAQMEDPTGTDVDKEYENSLNWWKNKPKKAKYEDKSFNLNNFERVLTSYVEKAEQRDSSGEVLIQIGSFRDYKLSKKLREKVKRNGLITSQERFEINGKTWYRVYIIHKSGVKKVHETYDALKNIGVKEIPIVRLINW